MTITWKDTTTYSRDDTRCRPTTWSATVGMMRITVTCGHIHYPGQWVMHARPWYDTHVVPLSETATLAEVQAWALDAVRKQARALLAAIG